VVSKKDRAPIAVTVAGITTEVMVLLPEKASSAMLVTPEGISTTPAQLVFAVTMFSLGPVAIVKEPVMVTPVKQSTSTELPFACAGSTESPDKIKAIELIEIIDLRTSNYFRYVGKPAK
jgi:hypothetical protein